MFNQNFIAILAFFILIESMKYSKRAFSIIEVVLVLVILGLLAAVFVPATERVQDKVRADMVEKQLSTIITAARSFMTERSLQQVDFNTLLNEKRIKPLTPICGEKYDDIVIKEAGGTIELKFSDGKIIERTY